MPLRLGGLERREQGRGGGGTVISSAALSSSKRQAGGSSSDDGRFARATMASACADCAEIRRGGGEGARDTGAGDPSRPMNSVAAVGRDVADRTAPDCTQDDREGPWRGRLSAPVWNRRTRVNHVHCNRKWNANDVEDVMGD